MYLKMTRFICRYIILYHGKSDWFITCQYLEWWSSAEAIILISSSKEIFLISYFLGNSDSQFYDHQNRQLSLGILADF